MWIYIEDAGIGCLEIQAPVIRAAAEWTIANWYINTCNSISGIMREQDLFPAAVVAIVPFWKV
jgi:hypothetical protein